MELTKSIILKTDVKYDLFSYKNEKELMIFYKNVQPLIADFVEKGFKNEFNDYKYSELFKFSMKLIQRAEEFTGLKGTDKKTMVINMVILLIENFLPISSEIKKTIG